MLNPTDIFRLVNFIGLDNRDVSGVLSVAINASLSHTQLFLALIAWVILPLALAIFIFKKKKL